MNHALPRNGIEAVGGFVKDQQPGPMRECLGKLDELLHPKRVAVHLAVPDLAQSNVEERFMSAFQRLCRGQAGEFGHVADEVNAAHVADEGIVLRHISDAAADLRPIPVRVEVEDAGCSTRRAVKAKERVDQR